MYQEDLFRGEIQNNGYPSDKGIFKRGTQAKDSEFVLEYYNIRSMKRGSGDAALLFTHT